MSITWYNCVRLTAFFRGQPGQAGTRKINHSGFILLEQEMMRWHQLDHMQIICTSIQTDNHASTSPLSFYRLDALPAAHRTASKHWRQIKRTTTPYDTILMQKFPRQKHLSVVYNKWNSPSSLILLTWQFTTETYSILFWCFRRETNFLACNAILARYMPSLSVRLSQVDVLLKRLNIGSHKQRHTIDTEDLGKNQMASPPMEAPNAGGVG